MADDIKLKMNVDITDAKGAIDSFNKSAEKAFKSSNVSTQAWGNSLTKVTGNLQSTVNKMEELKSKQVPTDKWYELDKKLKEINSDIAKAGSELSKLQKHPVETAEYTQWKSLLEGANAELTKAQNALKGYDKSSAWTGMFQTATKNVESLRKELDNAKLVLYGFTSKGVYTGQGFRDAQREVYNYKQELSKAENMLYKLENSGLKYKDTAGFNQATQDVKTFSNQVTVAQQKVYDLETQGKQFDTTAIDNQKQHIADLGAEAYRVRQQMATEYVSGDQTAEYGRMGDQVNYVVRQGQLLQNKIDGVRSSTARLSSSFNNFRSTAGGAISNLIGRLRRLSSQSESTGNTHNKSFKKMLTTVLKYGFGIRSIFLLYKKLRTVISTGLSEMAKQFSDVADDVYTLKNSWSGFKASLVSAFQPIFSYVVPALSTLINYLTTAMNALANFFALLTGQGYYYKAKKGNESVAESIGGTGSAAADANEELAEYDDLLVIDQDSGSGGGSGGSGSSDSDAWNWEKVDVEANSLAEKLSNMWDVFKSAWENKGQAVITAASYALNSLKELLSTIASTIYKVFIDGYGQSWLESVLDVVKQILLTIGDISSAWTTAWNKDNNGYNMVASFFTMLTSINSMIASIMQSWRNAWNDGTGVSIVTNILHIITNINNTITNLATNFTKAWEQAGIGDKIMSDILERINIILDFINRITASTESWSKKINFHPLLVSIEGVLDASNDILEDILDITGDIYERYVLPLTKKLTEDTIPEFLDSVETGLEGIEDVLESLDPWLEDYIIPALETLTELGLDVVLEAFKTRMDEFSDACSSISDVLDTLKEIFDSLGISFVSVKDNTEETTSAMTTAWNLFKQAIVANPITLQLTLIKDSFTLTKTTITTVWGALTSFFSGLWEDIKEVFSNVKEWFSEKFSGALDAIKEVFGLDDDTTWSDIGKNIVEGIWEGFKLFTPIVFVIDDFFNWVVDKIKEVFGINSPAENVKYLGGDILLGILQGFKDKFTNIGTTVSNLYTTFKSKLSEKFKNFSITDILSNVGNIAITLTTTLAGGLTKLADFTGLSTFFTNVKTKWNNLKSTLKTTLSGAFSSITGSNSLTSLSSLWSGLKEKWVDKSATLKTFLGGQMSYVSDLTTWTNAFSTLRSTWADKTATMKAYVGGAVSSIEDIVSDSATSWKTKFTTFVNTIWQDKTATMKATANIGGQSDNTLSNFKYGGGWYNTVTNFTGNIWKNTSALFSTTAKVGDTTNNSLSEMTSSGSSNGWYKRFTSFVNTWKQGATASFTSKFTNSDTNSQGYKNLTALRSAWNQTATAQFTSTYTNSDMNSAGYQNFNALWQNWYGRNADFTLSFSGNTADIKSLANNVLDKAYDALDRSGIKVKNKVWMARGGIVAGLTNLTDIMVGEAGAEAIVPLESNLGWLDKIATMISDKLVDTDLPDVVMGKTLPSTQEFISTFTAGTKNIEYLLEEVINRLSALEDERSDMQPIQIQVDGRTVAQVVWDETEKRYKQTGVRYGF